MTTEPARRRFSVDEYYEMARAGILGEDDRVELIAGEIVEMSPIGRRHAACVDRLNHFIARQVGAAAIVRVQSPVRLSEVSEPEPDVALLHPRTDFYAADHPAPGDVFLIVEVAETSSRFDRLVKMPLYATSGIRECWLVDLEEGTVTVYREPAPEGYRRVQVTQRGDRVGPEALSEVELRVEDVLGS
jgi:Uma2 family endonuclease